MNIAIVAAAGRSSRMKEGNKLFMEAGGKSVLEHTLDAVRKHEEISEIIVVTSQDFFEDVRGIAGDCHVVIGGESRQESVEKGLGFVGEKWGENGEDVVVVVHNAANPLVSGEEISEVIKAAREFGAAVVGDFSVNTVKKVNEGFVEETVDRSGLFEVQTPQAIRYELFVEALEKARSEGFVGTDDVSLVENLGGRVKHIAASEHNFKITTDKHFKFFKYLIEHDGI